MSCPMQEAPFSDVNNPIQAHGEPSHTAGSQEARHGTDHAHGQGKLGPRQGDFCSCMATLSRESRNPGTTFFLWLPTGTSASETGVTNLLDLMAHKILSRLRKDGTFWKAAQKRGLEACLANMLISR